VSHLNAFTDPPPDANRGLSSTPLEREAILQQLERILAHPFFRHSKRYPNLLRYIVEQGLKGDMHLKERTLGVEVFGSEPDYDTNEDPVVRIAAGEIRKRIAQYYHEPGHEAEMRIDLPHGSYSPEFHLPVDRITENRQSTSHTTRLSTVVHVRDLFGSRLLVCSLAVVLVVAAALAMARVRLWVPPRPIQAFWGPILDSPAPALVCVGDPSTTLRSQGTEQLTLASDLKATDFSVSNHVHGGAHVAFSDANTLFRLAALLGNWGKTTRLGIATATTLTDLREGPVVLVAAFDNEWTMRISRSLRYHFYSTADHGSAWIGDGENSSRRDWMVDFNQKYSQLTQDYAIVSRFADPTTGQPVVIAAGLGENGTIAAGEFLTNTTEMEEAMKHAPKNWRKENIEIVIATQVINGKSGPPRVIATHYW
jgi:hypothetical protein